MWTPASTLLLWAEDPARWRSVDPALGRRHPAGDLHPYAHPAAEVADLLRGASGRLEWLADRAAPTAMRLRLPERRGVPVPSPELDESDPEAVAPGPVTLAVRQVPGLLLDPALAAQLLGELAEESRWPHLLLTTPPGGEALEVLHGPGLRWLVAVHDAAWRAAGHGAVLPALVRTGAPAYARTAAAGATGAAAGAAKGSATGAATGPATGTATLWQARWRPLPDPHRRADLAAACPRAAYALDGDDRDPAGVLDDALAALVDAETRVALGPAPLEEVEGPAGRWLGALTGPEAGVAGTDDELLTLRAQVLAWTARAAAAAAAARAAGTGTARPPGDARGLTAAPLRLVLRVVEPSGPAPDGSDDPDAPRDPGAPTDGSDDPWRLELLLQAAARPALTVEAADVWAGGPARAALAGETGGPPEDVLLALLIGAARVWPPLREVLRDPRPTALAVTRDQVLGFLDEGAPALAAAGVGVHLPAWWTRPPRLSLLLTATAVPGTVPTASVVDRRALVAFRWRAALGDAELTADELEGLAAAATSLVRVRGRWVRVDPVALARALDFLRSGAAAGEIAVDAVLTAAVTRESPVPGLPVAAVTADGWLGAVLDGSTGLTLPPVVLPAGFTPPLRAYQERGVAWLLLLTRLGLGAVLADDMGLGKTLQVLALLAAEGVAAEGVAAEGWAAGERDEGSRGPVLVVCPVAVVGVWAAEGARSLPGWRVHVHHGAGRSLPEPLSDLVVTTYGTVLRDVEQLAAVDWRRLVVDEAQAVKNSAGQQAQALRALPARHRLALTGTPVENRLAELHAVLDLVDPGRYGSATAFRERWSAPVERYGSEAARDELRRLTRPVLLRRLKSDPDVAPDLPERRDLRVPCSLTPEQAGLYQAVVDDLLRRLREARYGDRRGYVLAAITRLKQVCDSPAYFLRDGSPLAARSGKLTRLEEVLEASLAVEERTLVFTQYAEFGAMLQPHLAARLGTDVAFLHGGLTRRERDRMVAAFQRPDGPGVLVASLRAGGTGLTLTAATSVVHVDRWWNPAVEDQASDRAHRIGQSRRVDVRTLVCTGTVEERIDEVLTAKRQLARGVLGVGEGWLGDLSTAALADLVALRESAVEDAG